MNGASSSFLAASISSIKIDGLGGDDTISLEGNAGISVSVLGGPGDDTISLTPLPGTKACGTVYASELDPGPNGGTVNTPLAGVRSPWMAPKMP